MGNELSSAEVRAREVVQRFEEALDRQYDAVEARSWPHAPKHIREAHGDPSLPDPPSREAMDAWSAWLDLRENSRRRCRENLEKGADAVRGEPARAEVYWKRAISTAERALAELDDGSRVASPIPVLGAVTASSTAAAEQAASSSADSDVGDIFAGCFLSLAGSLVGSAIGTVAVAIRVLPEVNVGELVVRFVTGFLVGVVVGFIATFAAAPLAIQFGRSHADNVWVGAVAIAAATGAAVTAWLLIAV